MKVFVMAKLSVRKKECESFYINFSLLNNIGRVPFRSGWSESMCDS